jgi:hypothetical protein
LHNFGALARKFYPIKPYQAVRRDRLGSALSVRSAGGAFASASRFFSVLSFAGAKGASLAPVAYGILARGELSKTGKG